MTKGFFSATTMAKQPMPLPLVAQCGSCKLDRECQSPYMPVSGQGKRRVLILAEAPGREEDKQNIQLIGNSGQELIRLLSQIGVDMRRDCWLTNAVVCRPTTKSGQNRNPTTNEINFCNPPETPMWMSDFSFKPLGEIKIGNMLMGWTRVDITEDNRTGKGKYQKKEKGRNTRTNKKKLTTSRVLAIHQREAQIVRITLASGRVIRCTPDHLWLSGNLGYNKSQGGDQFYPAKIGKSLSWVVDPVGPIPDNLQYAAGYFGAMMDGEGCWDRSGAKIGQSKTANGVVCRRLEQIAKELGFDYSWHDFKTGSCSVMIIKGELNAAIKFLNWCKPAKKERIHETIMRRSSFASPDQVISIEPDGFGSVIGLTTTTGNYVAWGYASKNCRPNLRKTLEQLKPDVIIPIGKAAARSLMALAWKDGEVEEMQRWAGWDIPSSKLNSWLCPTYHPAFLLREKEANRGTALELHMQRHLRQAFSHNCKPWPKPPDWESKVTVEMNPRKAAQAIRAFQKTKLPLAFDLETSMLKPDAEDSEILCCSVSDGKTAVAFPWQGEAIDTMEDLLLGGHPMIAANMQHEQRWIKREFGQWVKNMWWDTMLGGHWRDCRRKINSLKFQAFVLLGVPDYSSVLEPYMKPVDPKTGKHKKGCNYPNRLKEVEPTTLLRYCALDSLFEATIAHIQREKWYER